MLEKIMQEKGMSRYQLSKRSGVPWATVSDICSGKSDLWKCTAETVYKLAKALDVTMEALLQEVSKERLEKMERMDFDLFRSQVCHQVKERGDLGWMAYILETNGIRVMFEKQWYPEAFYQLAMLDYLSRLHQVERCGDYEDIRGCKLRETIYPGDVAWMAEIKKEPDRLEKARKKSIPEFLRFNIVEPEVRDSV